MVAVAESAVLVAIGSSMASAVLKSVLEKCVDAVSKTSSAAGLKSAILGNLKPQLVDLQRQLTKLDALLCFPESLDLLQHNQNDLMSLWLQSVKEAADFADNLLEDISYDQLRRKAEGNMVSKLFNDPDGSFTFRMKVGHRIDKFKSMAKNIYNEADTIGLRLVELVADPTRYYASASMSADLREVRENVDTSTVVGRQSDESLVVGELCLPDNIQVLGVIALIGISGVGKTTLARRIYDNPTVTDYYKKKTWIFVSEDFSLRRVLDEMLQSITGDAHNLTNIEAIEHKLRGCFQEERYLLVLDDVSNTDQQIWDSIRSSLARVTDGCTCSMILVTTQHKQVVTVMEAYMTCTVDILSKDDAWELFQGKAFANKSQQQVSDLMGIGKRILSKCGGLPLAINTLGSLLGSMHAISQWESVDRSEVWQMQTRIMPWLLISFNRLPNATVKQCFAHCSVVLKKGDAIEDERLIYYLISQGIIKQSQTSHQGIMEIDQLYIQPMLSNGLLQRRDGSNYLWMHDLMHELAGYVSSDKSLFILQLNDLHKSFLGVKHVLIHGCDTGNSPHTFLKGHTQSTLRTLFCFNAPISLDFIAQSRLLRTLVLRSCGLKEIPESIGRLKHLRILDLFDNPIQYLPESIGRLYNLQLLDLTECSSLVQLPLQVTKLLDLRVIATTKAVHIPKGLGQLTLLTRLPVIKLKAGDACKIKELSGLQHLMGDVWMEQLENILFKGDAVEADLSSKEGITRMRLVWTSKEQPGDTNCYSDEEVLEGLQPHSNLRLLSLDSFRGKRFSDWLSKGLHCTNLTHLWLLYCKDCEHLPTLGCLPSLQVLVIDGLESVQVIGNNFCDREAAVCSGSESTSQCFPRLKSFKLYNMPKLKDWFESTNPHASSFPCLEELKIVECPLLFSAPSCFSSLQQLTVIGVNSGESVLMILNSAYNLSSLVVENVEQLTLLSDSLLKCTHLRTIRIRGCNDLEGLPPTLRSLCYLRKLEIQNCDSLTSIPDIEGLLTLTTLYIKGCKNVTQAPCGLASCVSIEGLHFLNCPKLKLLPDLGSLSCLRNMTLCSISEECLVPSWINHLSSLQFLFIGGFNEKLDIFGGIDRLPTCLRSLVLCGWPKLKSLPKELQTLTQLERLTLFHFDGVISLPEWLANLSSLQYLGITYCKSMKSLPTSETMHSLSRLTTLRIRDCPVLEERCRPDGGVERLKVAPHTHIQFE